MPGSSRETNSGRGTPDGVVPILDVLEADLALTRQVEALLRTLRGIVLLGVRVDAAGEVGAIRVSPKDGRAVEDVVRIVQTALLASLRLFVPASRIFVVPAVLDSEPGDQFAAAHQGTSVPHGLNGERDAPDVWAWASTESACPTGKPRVLELQLIRPGPATFLCRVVIGHGVSRGTGEALGRGEGELLTAVAEAVLYATRLLHGSAHPVCSVKGVELVEVGGQHCAISVVRIRRGWDLLEFVGAALLEEGPERAVASATLEALTKGLPAGWGSKSVPVTLSQSFEQSDD
jgi:hypothetical protein